MAIITDNRTNRDSAYGLKITAFVALLEYAFVRPFIMRPGESDFISFVFVHSLLAYFGKINILGLDADQRKRAFKFGLAGGLLGYAWMLLYIKYDFRDITHLFIANTMILLGVLYGARVERRKLPRSQRTPGNGLDPNRSVPKGFLDPTSRMCGMGGCAGGNCA